MIIIQNRLSATILKPGHRTRDQKLPSRWPRWIAILMTATCGLQEARGRTLATEARIGLSKAAAYFRHQVAVRGGYVYYSREDLQQRWGYGEATATQIWVQPPGTPTVGLAFVKAYEATGDRFHLEAANEAAQALLFGQLKSGGWAHAIDFDPKGSRSAQYRNGKGAGKNYSTLDDDVTQAALRFLINLDRVHRFKHEPVHEATLFGLNALLKAQFPNGGFPQVWSAPVPKHPVMKASYPAYDWRTEKRIKEYWNLYTLNDNLAGDVAKTLILAHEVYRDPKYRDALTRLGDFLILAQMPDPQPAWCQQYNFEMKPAWARKFEPPAITSSESFDVMRALMMIARATDNPKYLEPIPGALAYFERSLLPDGQLPRYLELQSNRPLYLQRKGKAYSLTYDDANLPTHYAFKINPHLDTIRREFEELRSNQPVSPSPTGKSLEGRVRKILDDLDEQGRWISIADGERLTGQPKFAPGSRFLSSARFAKNMHLLSSYLRTLKEESK